MSVTRKVTGLTMIVAGFTFFAWVIALNTISPAIPEGLQGTAKLFMILSGVTGVGFLVSGGMTFFGQDQYEEERRNDTKKDSSKNSVYKPLPKPLFASAAPQNTATESDDITVEVGGDKKKEDEEKKEGWDAPSKTGWG